MKFRFVADFEFDADDIDDALMLVARHLVEDIDIGLIGMVNCKRVRDVPDA